MSAEVEVPGRGRTVLLVLHGEEVGGASLSVLRIVPRLEALGWRTVVWCPRPSDLFEEVSARGIEVHGEPRPFAGYSWSAMRIGPGPLARVARVPRYFAALARLVRDLDPALAHCNSLYTVDEAALLRALRVPVVFHVHEMLGSSSKHAYARRLLHSLASVVVGVSKASAARLGHPDRPVWLVPECVEAPAQVPSRTERSGPVRVGMVGVIAKRKGPDIFIEAARLLARRDTDVEFHLVGAPTDPLDATWAKGVLEEAKAAGVSHELRADVETRLAEWDIFALPSRVDPFPIVVLEAMASALPVVAATVDGIPEQLGEETGVLIAPEDPAALAEAIGRLASDGRTRRQIGAAARERVLARFSLDRQARDLSAAYQAALGEAGAIRYPLAATDAA